MRILILVIILSGLLGTGVFFFGITHEKSKPIATTDDFWSNNETVSVEPLSASTFKSDSP